MCEEIKSAICVLARTYNNPEFEYHTFAYTKQKEDASLLMLTSTLDATICPHAFYHVDSTTYPCKNYVGGLTLILLGRAAWITMSRRSSFMMRIAAASK